MISRDIAIVVSRLETAAADSPGLQLLVLHGSRARGDSHEASDWDFAYQASPSFDPDALLAVMATALKADRIDLVDLARASALLRYRAARDAVVVFERDRGIFERFWIISVDTWCDLAPVLESEYAHLLEALRS